MTLIDPESRIESTRNRLDKDCQNLSQIYEYIDNWQKLFIDTIDREVRQSLKNQIGGDVYQCINEIRVKLDGAISELKSNLEFLDGDIEKLRELINLSRNQDILGAAYARQAHIQDAHEVLDSLKVPRTNSLGNTYTIAGRIWTLNQEGHKIPPK